MVVAWWCGGGVAVVWWRCGSGVLRLIGKHAIYAVSSLPAASGRAATVVYVNDESGGATMAFSDGINWRRVQDRAIVK